MNTFKVRLLSVFLLAGLLAMPPGFLAQARGSIIYVDQDAIHGLNDGTSWKNAYLSLQFALADAVSGDDIRVAEGTYKPTTGSDRTATFQLKDGVRLYGGYDGTESGTLQRDPATHITILSGDIGTPGDPTDNSYHVVKADGTTDAGMHGFTITGGNANVSVPDNAGGGLSFRSAAGSSLALTEMIFRDNSAGYGGGIYNGRDSDLTLERVTFENNIGEGTGGGINNGGSAALRGITFKGNTSQAGGGIYNYGTMSVINSTFYDNHATTGPGMIGNGGAISNDAVMAVFFSTFSHNSALEQGAGIYNSGSELTLHDSILANSISGVDCYNDGGALTTSHNLIENNASGANACGTPLLTSDPNLGLLRNNGGYTQTMALLAGSPALEAANDALCPNADQRSMARPQGTHCDLGAYELAYTPPGPAMLSSPTGSLETNTPFYLWNVVDNATWYYLWVDGPSGNVLKQWYSAEQADCDLGCEVAPGMTLSSGTYTWWVQTWNEAGYGPWSDGMTFTVPVPPLPGEATLVSPTVATGTKTPAYTWNGASDATWYYLWVNGPSGNVIQQWYQASAICSEGSCSITPTTNLSAGTYTWWVRTWNDAGYGPWSDAMTFSFALPGKATLNAPMGISMTTTPTYNWNEVPGATWYYLWVNNTSGGNVIKKWYQASTVCSGGFCAVTPTTSLSAGVSYTWWVQTWNELGYGPWSDPLSFTVIALP